MKLRHWRRRHAQEAAQLERDKARLEAVKDRWPAVHHAAETMRTGLARNHFAEAIGKAMGVER